MTDSKQILPIQGNTMAKLAGWASVVNIISWLLTAIPGFLNSAWSMIEYVTIPLSTILALVAGTRGLIKGKAEERAVGQCVIAIFVGGLNVLLIVLIIIVMIGLRGIW